MSTWTDLALAAVVLLHLAFIVFVMTGGLLVLRWTRAAWLHLPACAWGAYVEFSGRICPLTPIENALRRAAGRSGYAGGFVEHHLLPLIYPSGLTRDMQATFGMAVVTVNAAVYGWAWWRRRSTRLNRSAGARTRTGRWQRPRRR